MPTETLMFEHSNQKYGHIQVKAHIKNYFDSLVQRSHKKTTRLWTLSKAPPLQAGLDAKSLDAQTWFGPPSPYRSLGILTQKNLKLQNQFLINQKVEFF